MGRNAFFLRLRAKQECQLTAVTIELKVPATLIRQEKGDPGGPVVRTSLFHCQGPSSRP